MNTANLQLEGVYAVLAALIEAMIAKDVFERSDLTTILADVERSIGADSSRPAEIRAANIEAAQFPARFLKAALRAAAEGRISSFSETAARIKESRDSAG